MAGPADMEAGDAIANIVIVPPAQATAKRRGRPPKVPKPAEPLPDAAAAPVAAGGTRHDATGRTQSGTGSVTRPATAAGGTVSTTSDGTKKPRGRPRKTTIVATGQPPPSNGGGSSGVGCSSAADEAQPRQTRGRAGQSQIPQGSTQAQGSAKGATPTRHRATAASARLPEEGSGGSSSSRSGSSDGDSSRDGSSSEVETPAGKGARHRRAPPLPAAAVRKSAVAARTVAKRGAAARGGGATGSATAGAAAAAAASGSIAMIASTSQAGSASEALDEQDELDVSVLDGVDLKEVFQELVRGGWHHNASRKRARLETLHSEQAGWILELREGFSVLLYGWGSKRSLLNDFARRALAQDCAAAAASSSSSPAGIYTFNGWSAALTARHVVLTAAKALSVGTDHKSLSTSDLLALIAAEPADRRLFLVLHNIDGPGLRSAAEQVVLSRLAACANIHLIASVDHINAPLLWDSQVAGRFRWVFHDATTFEPYTAENVDVPSVLTGCGRQSSQRSIGAVLRSLPANAREVFRVLAERQLEEGDEFPGLAYGDLYNVCRRRFIVANDAALRGHLKEFADHEVIASRVDEEGDELLYVPHAPEALRKAMDAMDAK